MEVTCEHCKMNLNVPDEKIPHNQLVNITCPKCKNKIRVDSRESVHNDTSATDNSAEAKTLDFKSAEQNSEKRQEERHSDKDYSDDESLVFFDGNTKIALLMAENSDSSSKIRRELEELEFKCIESSNIRDALGKLRYHNFDLVLLADGFDGQELNSNPVLQYLNHLSMSSRRKIFLVLMGDKFKSLNEMIAFSMSANVVINPNDIDKLNTILKKGISDHERLYKVFTDTMIELGKA